MAIYFDNAATSPLDSEVLATMLPFLETHHGNPSSVHQLGRKTRAAIERVRKAIAQSINASTGEIFFTSGGTESTNAIFCGAVRDLGVKHIITSPLEHHCVLHTVEHLCHTHQIHAHYAGLLPNGHIDLEDLRSQLQSLNEPTLVSLMHGNNEIGNLLDLEKVADICAENNAFFHSDTVQTFGFHRFDVQKTKFSFMTGSAHKFYGPKGIGFLYINGDNNIKPNMFGGAQERNMRAGTENLYGIVGLGKAVEIAYRDFDTVHEHIKTLKQHFITAIKALIPDVSFNGDAEGASLDKVINVSFPKRLSGDLLLMNLDIAGICASGGSACSSGSVVGSHVLNAMGVASDVSNVRFSFSKYNTIEEIEECMRQLAKILKINS
ncbi:MAG: cysteine desulfurase family protein [Chitinophagales bacterium]